MCGALSVSIDEHTQDYSLQQQNNYIPFQSTIDYDTTAIKKTTTFNLESSKPESANVLHTSLKGLDL